MYLSMDDTTTAAVSVTEPAEVSELRATVLLFALMLILPALLGTAFLGLR